MRSISSQSSSFNPFNTDDRRGRFWFRGDWFCAGNVADDCQKKPFVVSVCCRGLSIGIAAQRIENKIIFRSQTLRNARLTETIETYRVDFEMQLKKWFPRSTIMDQMKDISDIPSVLLGEAFEALAEGIAIFGSDERLVVCNQRYKDLLGPMADLIEPGMHWRDLIQGCVARGLIAQQHESGEDWIERSERQRNGYEQDTEIRHLDGRCYQVSYHPTKSGGFVVTRSDVTEMCAAEKNMHEREALLSTILKTNPTPVVMSRLSDASVVYRSSAAVALLGESWTVASALDWETFVATLEEKGRVDDYIIRGKRADGSELIASISASLTTHDRETCVVSSITDLTERVEREEVIRRVVESCPTVIMVSNAETGDIIYKSRDDEALFGTGDNSRDFYVNPRDRLDYLRQIREHGAVTEFRMRLINAEEKPFWAAVSGRMMDWDGTQVVVNHVRDLTAQLAIEAELNRQREQVFHNEKMSALGGLLAGVAHELNNPLSVIVGHAMMLEDEVEDENVLRQARKISDAASRSARIVKTFLTMARQEPAKMEEVDVGEIVETAVEVSRYGETGGIRIVSEIGDMTDEVCADADQLTQVVINLILNAQQAITASGKGDTIRISTGPGTADGEVQIVVDDNGPGIAPEIRGRIFEPFFTTKGVGKGTGIGLAMCHRIVVAHEGRVSVGVSPDEGARFTIAIPSHSKGSTGETSPARQDANTPSGCHVLVIDDEVEVADLNAEILVRGGYKATAAYGAEDACDLLRSGQFDVVVTDVNMPGVDGRGLFQLIKNEFSHLAAHVGFITGDTLGQTSQRFLEEANRPFLEKPVAPEELREFVARLSHPEAAE